MASQPLSYLLPDELDLEGVRQQLSTSNTLREEAVSEASQTFYDSFDWRIWQAGGELAHETGEGGRLCWFDRRSGEPQACVQTDQPPDFSEKLPPGPLRERLTAALEMRIVLPQVRILQKLRTLRVLDEEEKTVVRVVLQENRYASPDGSLSGELEGRVQLLPLKGYDDYFESLRSQLDGLGLIASERTLYDDALLGIGRKAGDYSSRLNYQLDPDARADATAKKIMLSLLDTLEANVEGSKANLDSEFLHDLRVATRRTRSAMTQIKGVFEPKALQPFKQGMGWIGKVTGPTRDMDVYLLQFPAYRASLPAAVQADLDPFHEFLIRHHAEAQRTLVRKLNSPHFRKLIKSWRAWLNKPVPEKPKAPNALRPISELSDQRIRKLYSQVLKAGAAIAPDSPPERLHDLRAPAGTIMAMGILVGRLFERQAVAREDFAALFAAFSSEDNRRAFQKLFGSQ
ncbi:MAG: CHAD domain-containing protein [Candidatus Thiodiazotropha sp.]